MRNRPLLQSRVVIQDDARYFSRGWPGGPPRGIAWHATDSTRWMGKWGTHWYLTSGKKQASYHYAIEDDGTIYRFLNPGLHRAWHAGKLAGVGQVSAAHKALVRMNSVNSTCIGVAFVRMNARGTGRLTARQLESGLWLGSVLQERFDIPNQNHGMHHEFCPTWKSDVLPENLNADHWRRLLALPEWPTAITSHPIVTC